MKDIIKAIEDSSWSSGTKKTRIGILNFIRKDLGIEDNNFDFLKDNKLVEKYILDRNKNPNTAFSKLVTIKNCLALIDKRTAAKYDNLANKLTDKIIEYKDNNKVDANKLLSEDYMIEIPYIIGNEIKEIYGRIFLSEFEFKDLETNKNKCKYMKMLTDYIVSVFYLWQPPVRAEFGIMTLNKSDKHNWYDPKNKTVHYNDFKNVKSFGSKSFVLNKEVSDELTKYLKVLSFITKDKDRVVYMFNTSYYKPFTRASFCSYFHNMLKRYTGRDLTINNIRHSFETNTINNKDYNKLTIGQKRAIHERLLHRWTTAAEYQQISEE